MNNKPNKRKDKDNEIRESETDDKIQKELKRLIELNDLRAGALRKMIDSIGATKKEKNKPDKY